MSRTNTPKRVSTLALMAAGLLVALILAGIVSFYADADPDGLSKVAEDKGFSSSETEHGTADGTFSGYATRGIDNARLSGGVAGVVGCAVVLLIAGGVAFAVRRRDAEGADGSDGGRGGGAGDRTTSSV